MAKLAYHFYLKDKNTINLTPTNLHFGIGNFRKKIAIGESIFVLLWDIDKERAIISSSESRNNQALAKRVNRAIADYRFNHILQPQKVSYMWKGT